jgi:hypothetical protein
VTTLEDRLRSRLVPADGECVEWTGGRNAKGYGVLSRGRRGEKQELTHRVAWEFTYGPVPDGLCVLHRCDNPACCNVDHLFLGTQADNMADMAAKGRAARGERNGATKLTWPVVREIRASNEPHRVIASRLGISERNVRKVRAMEIWR